MALRLRALLLSACMLPAAALAQSEPEEIANDVVHADLPLFTDDSLEPRRIDLEGTFGCGTRVNFGDWKLVEHDGYGADTEWYRFANHGVFHCAAVISSSYERDQLARNDARLGYFVHVADTKAEGRDIELWALQLGMRPGSDYLLLAREPKDGLIESFDVLQTACPEGHLREVEIDSFLTGYCSINTRSAFVNFARSMLALPARGVLTYVGESPKDEVEEER
jgi:hypothetical protein